MKVLLNFFKNNLKIFIAFLVGAIIFSGITCVVAATIQSSSVTYTTSKNTSVTNVKQAVDDLYDKTLSSEVYSCYNTVCGKLSYRYWIGGTYNKNSIPATTYKSKDELANSISNFNGNTFYIKSVLIDGNVIGHEVCWREFCMAPHYCPSDFVYVATYEGIEYAYKMRDDIYYATGVNLSCSGNKNMIYCRISGSLSLSAKPNGDVQFGSCSISGAGVASC